LNIPPLGSTAQLYIDKSGSANLFVQKPSDYSQNMNIEDVLTHYNPCLSRMDQQAANYAQECYGANSSRLMECDILCREHSPLSSLETHREPLQTRFAKAPPTISY
jgi:hypothetical protein